MKDIDKLTQEEINKINLKCSNEVNKSIEINNNYAYCTLVMLGDLFIPGAMVLAYSLRLLKTKADIIVMITDDVSIEGRKLLSMYFDKVILVDYIKIETKRGSHKIKEYLNYVFTKLNFLTFTQYKKIIFIDADAICLKSFDKLFALNAPAGSIIPEKDDYIKYGDHDNYAIADDLTIDWYKKYCDVMPHGSKIPKKLTDDVIVNFGMGVAAGLLLIEPNISEFNKINNILKTDNKIINLITKKFNWPEQQFLTYYWSGKWTSIDPRYLGLQAYPDISILPCLQYAGSKPWFPIRAFNQTKDFDLDRKIKYKDMQIWHKLWSKILNLNPELFTNDVLNESNEYHIEFIKRYLKFYKNITFEMTPEDENLWTKKD